MRSGITELSDEVKKQYHEQAICYYAIISSIRQDIILRFQVFNIDFSFVEVILKDDISFVAQAFDVRLPLYDDLFGTEKRPK